ncbi:MAG: hypothetical protein OSA45_15730 [Halioglobus sp.]|jgi:hypothetical protein|nr:hypothetical protein [Halioglobus sp.]
MPDTGCASIVLGGIAAVDGGGVSVKECLAQVANKLSSDMKKQRRKKDMVISVLLSLIVVICR